MAVYEVRRKLPVAHSLEIGRIITRWAFLEWQLKNTLYAVLRVSPKQGRLAIRERNGKEYVDVLRDLLRLGGISVSVDLNRYGQFLEILGAHRHRLAHGIWIRHPKFKEPILQITKGKWQPDPSKPSAKRIIDPEGVLIRVKELRQFPPLIDQAADIAVKLEREIRNAIDPH